jgi:hypothetical protein
MNYPKVQLALSKALPMDSDPRLKKTASRPSLIRVAYLPPRLPQTLENVFQGQYMTNQQSQ